MKIFQKISRFYTRFCLFFTFGVFLLAVCEISVIFWNIVFAIFAILTTFRYFKAAFWNARCASELSPLGKCSCRKRKRANANGGYGGLFRLLFLLWRSGAAFMLLRFDFICGLLLFLFCFIFVFAYCRRCFKFGFCNFSNSDFCF